MLGSPREVEGKKAFQELIDLKIVQPVDVNEPCTWSSALHLQPKSSGGWRPVGDFRDLNAKTELDRYRLPVLRQFANKLRGSVWAGAGLPTAAASNQQPSQVSLVENQRSFALISQGDL